MKVYDSQVTGSAAAETGRAQESQRADRAGSGRSGATGTSGSGDRVELSSTLGRLAQAISADGAERASRVQALTERFRSGNYQPDAAATARGMVAEALATGGR